MSSEWRPGTKRAARQATEAAMLAAATRMLLAPGGVDLLASLKPVEIARQCEPPRTTGAFYNIWPTQEDFRRALLDHLLSLDRFAGDLATTEMLRDFVTRPDLSFADVIRTVATFNFTELKAEPAVLLQFGLWGQHRHDPEVRQRIRGLYRAITDSMHPLYTQFLERSGRRMRAPYDLEMFGVLVTGLVEGLLLRWAVDPDAVLEDVGPPPGEADDAPWGLFASAAYLLFVGMTEPIDE